jgi:hypothetical protein
LGQLSSPSVVLAEVRCSSTLRNGASGVHAHGPLCTCQPALPPFVQALQQRAEELGGDLSDQQKKELAEAFEKLGYSDLAAKAAP